MAIFNSYVCLPEGKPMHLGMVKKTTPPIKMGLGDGAHGYTLRVYPKLDEQTTVEALDFGCGQSNLDSLEEQQWKSWLNPINEPIYWVEKNPL